MRDKILVSEIFWTIQGEGALAGIPTIFVRTGGCDFHCGYSTSAALARNKPDGEFICDTLYAVDPKNKDTWEEMSASDIWQRVLDISRGYPLLVSLSGGNPALQPLDHLIELGHEDGYTFALETQGTVAQPWFSNLDHLVLSPKPPSARMPFNQARLVKCIDAAGRKSAVSLKIVVFDEADFRFAREVSEMFPALPCYLQAGTPQIVGKGEASGDPSKYRYLVAQIIEQTRRIIAMVERDRWHTARVSFQQHVILFGDQRGV